MDEKMRKLLLIIVNVIALVLVLSNSIQQVVIGATMVFSCNLFLLILYFNDPIYKESYKLNNSLGTAVKIMPVKSKYKAKQIISYAVEEGVLTEGNWESLRNVLNSFASEFLHKNYPSVEWGGQFYLMKYSEETAGTFINLGLYKNLLSSEKPIAPIILNEAFVYAVIRFNDFGIIKPIVEHELVHYALWRQGRGFQDHEEAFENELEKLNIRSNDASKTQIYSFGIGRIETENGFKDTLYLLIPPSKQGSEEECENIIKEYKEKYLLRSNDKE